MSSLATALVTFDEFMQLPDPEDARRFELHDGAVVLVPPAWAAHVASQADISSRTATGITATSASGDSGAVRLYRAGESVSVLGLLHINVSAIFAPVK